MPGRFGYRCVLIDKHWSGKNVCLTQMSGWQHCRRPKAHRTHLSIGVIRSRVMFSKLMRSCKALTTVSLIWPKSMTNDDEVSSIEQMIVRTRTTREYIEMIPETWWLIFRFGQIHSWYMFSTHLENNGRLIRVHFRMRPDEYIPLIETFSYIYVHDLPFVHIQWNAGYQRSSWERVELFLRLTASYQFHYHRKLMRKRVETSSYHICSHTVRLIHREERTLAVNSEAWQCRDVHQLTHSDTVVSIGNLLSEAVCIAQAIRRTAEETIEALFSISVQFLSI